MNQVAAAAVPLGALTAWQALHEHARLRPGQLGELGILIDKQQVRPIVSAVFELSALPCAFRAQRTRRDPGKVVVAMRRAAQLARRSVASRA